MFGLQHLVFNVMRLVCIFLLACSVSVHAESQADAWHMIQKAAVASHILSYTGIFVYTNDTQTKAVQVKHIYDGKGEYARNVTLDARPKELFTEGQGLVIYNQKKEKVVIKKRQDKNIFPNVLPLNIRSLKSSYEAHAAESGTVAGRAVRLILLLPKDNYRYTYRVWVDQEYGMVLKYQVQNAKHKVLESVAFNEINLVKKLDLDWFKPQIDTSKSYEMEDPMPIVPDATGHKHWQIVRLPVGYQKVNQVKVHAHNDRKPMTQLIFSDGLSSVSMFIESVSEEMRPFVGHYAKGNTSLYANVRHGYQITVVGEVPKDAVIEFGQAIEFHPKQATNAEQSVKVEAKTKVNQSE